MFSTLKNKIDLYRDYKSIITMQRRQQQHNNTHRSDTVYNNLVAIRTTEMQDAYSYVVAPVAVSLATYYVTFTKCMRNTRNSRVRLINWTILLFSSCVMMLTIRICFDRQNTLASNQFSCERNFIMLTFFLNRNENEGLTIL